MRTRLLRIILPIIAIILFLLPGWEFFSARGGLAFLAGADFRTASRLLFPLAGLYAFFLVWLQVMLGSNMPLWRKLWPGIVRYHKTEGVFALLFAVTHPTLLLIGYGLSGYLNFSFVAPELTFFVWLGEFQLLLICLTAGTALLMKVPWLQKRWHAIHLLNYVVFVSVWTHSWFLGTDVQSSNLKYLWFFYALTFTAAVTMRISRAVYGNPAAAPPAPDAGLVPIGPIGAVKEGAPLCVEAGGKKLALFKMGDRYHAIDNACPHQGGPLCQGKIKNGVVVCPWHASEFKIETGALVRGPATRGVNSYPVEVRDGRLMVRLGAAPGAPSKPVPAKLSFETSFDPDHPFDHEPFFKDVVEGLKFPWKLYGALPIVVIGQSADETDAWLGEVHATEMDLKKLSALMDAVNAKWKTQITYCLYHTSQFPDDTLLNIRGPQAPNNIAKDITF